MLAAAVKTNGGAWPSSKRDAYELSCLQLMREHNARHEWAINERYTLSDEQLLLAAGWLCSLLLLSNHNTVRAIDDQSTLESTSVDLREVLDLALIGDLPKNAVNEVLHRRVFAKPGNFAPVHRTVAEYLAARFVSYRLKDGGLLPSRIGALMLAGPQYIVSNLRGLAGWLGALCEPLRDILFEADPAAILEYGDLSLLPPVAKRHLIEKLASIPTFRYKPYYYDLAQHFLPLVTEDTRDYVQDWLSGYLNRARQHDESTSSAGSTVAYILLVTLSGLSPDEYWVDLLSLLVHNNTLSESLRRQALQALIVHAKKQPGRLLDQPFQGDNLL